MKIDLDRLLDAPTQPTSSSESTQDQEIIDRVYQLLNPTASDEVSHSEQPSTPQENPNL